MDPITSAIVLGVAGNLATDALTAAYTSLKEALTKKHGEEATWLMRLTNWKKHQTETIAKQQWRLRLKLPKLMMMQSL